MWIISSLTSIKPQLELIFWLKKFRSMTSFSLCRWIYLWFLSFFLGFLFWWFVSGIFIFPLFHTETVSFCTLLVEECNVITGLIHTYRTLTWEPFGLKLWMQLVSRDSLIFSRIVSRLKLIMIGFKQIVNPKVEFKRRIS